MNATNTKKTALLLVVCLAQFMVILDVSIVNVALPAIGGGLHFSTNGLQWVVNAYTLTFAGFLMLGGRAADILGQRRVFLFGAGLFAVSSLLCAVAASKGLLIGARALQGFAGAVLSPATLALVTSSLAEGPERNRGLALWGAMGALGASCGVIAGGLLTQGLGWRSIFAINIPLGAAVIALALRVVPRVAAGAKRRSFDLTGAVLITGALVGVTYGIVGSDGAGWLSLRVLGPLLAGVALLAAFCFVEARIAKVPLVPLSIFRVRTLRAANIVVVLLYAGFFPVFFFLTLFLQHVLGYDAIETGLAFLPMPLSILTASTLAPRLVAALGARRVITGGMLLATCGMLLLTQLEAGDGYTAAPIIGSILVAFGMGCALVPATIVALQGLAGADHGLGSGVLNTSRLMGGALGLAVLSTIASARTRADAAAGAAHALTSGFDLAFAVGAGLCLAGALAAVTLLRPERGPDVASVQADAIAA